MPEGVRMPVAVEDGRLRPVVATPWRLLGVALIIQLGFSAIDQGIPLLTGFIKADLRLSSFVAGLAVSSFMFGKVFGAYVGGAAADRFGEREVLVAAGLISAGLVFIAITQPPLMLFPLVGAAGFASAASTPAGGRLILSSFPPERRGLALGIRQTGIPIAGVAVAIILPPLARASDWRWALAAAAAMTGLCVLPLYFTAVPKTSATVGTFAGGFRAMTKNRELVLLTIWGCLVVTGQYALLAFLALDLHEGRGISLSFASLAVATAQGAGIIGRVWWGAASDRVVEHGRRPLLVGCTAIGLASALALFLTPRTAPPAVVIAVVAVAGVALIGYQGLWITMIAEAAGPAAVGAATGFAVTFVVAAAAAAPPSYGLAADTFGTYRAVWAALSCVVALAFVPALLLRGRS
jgi:MFS family permease